LQGDFAQIQSYLQQARGGPQTRAWSPRRVGPLSPPWSAFGSRYCPLAGPHGSRRSRCVMGDGRRGAGGVRPLADQHRCARLCIRPARADRLDGPLAAADRSSKKAGRGIMHRAVCRGVGAWSPARPGDGGYETAG
jgi:hypothetical protein